ncbi:MAG: hypothetical protein CMF41_05375 [Legionellales bacterium]|nr:hypothetical protein [Legionellales bacterium]
MNKRITQIAKESIIIAGAKRRQLTSCNGNIFWLEGSGDSDKDQLFMYDDQLCEQEVPFNISSRVNEYGGGDLHVGSSGAIYTVNESDQQIYCRSDNFSSWVRITQTNNARYADMHETPYGVMAVQELHLPNEEVIQSIVIIKNNETRTLIEGQDFYAAPKLSPDKQKVAFLSWNHPNMPWDECILSIGDFSESKVQNIRRINTQTMEVISQFDWDSNNHLVYSSDKTGWSSMYVNTELVLDIQKDCGYDRWQFGGQNFIVMEPNSLIVVLGPPHNRQLGHLVGSDFKPFDLPFVEYGPWLAKVDSSHIVFIGYFSDQPEALVKLNIYSGEISYLISQQLTSWSGYQPTQPIPVEFKTRSGEIGYAFYYSPSKKISKKPALIVISHGGPTSRTCPIFNANILFWNDQGYAVVDVNYRGSTGYGRAYQDALKYQWGIRDVEDCVDVVNFLSLENLIDKDRCVIRGKSSGGLTTLNALIHHQCFKAGASHYGVTDLEGLVKITHRFESNYLDYLIGDYTLHHDRYVKRSPIHNINMLKSPVIFFQGTLDQVVPPMQSLSIVQQMRQAGLDVEYVEFEGERHGFKKQENKVRSLVDEMKFFNRVLDIE